MDTVSGTMQPGYNMSGLCCDGDGAAAARWRFCPRTAAVYPGEPCQEQEATGVPGLAGRAAIFVFVP